MKRHPGWKGESPQTGIKSGHRFWRVPMVGMFPIPGASKVDNSEMARYARNGFGIVLGDHDPPASVCHIIAFVRNRLRIFEL